MTYKVGVKDKPPTFPKKDVVALDASRKPAIMKNTTSMAVSLFDDNASVETIKRNNTTKRTKVPRRFQATTNNQTQSQRQPQQLLYVVPADKPQGLRTHSAPLRRSSREDILNMELKKSNISSYRRDGGDANVFQDYIDRFILQSPKKIGYHDGMRLKSDVGVLAKDFVDKKKIDCK